MQSAIDFESGGVAHGYTVDDDGNVWYWKWGGPRESVVFRDCGYPVDHPIKSGGVPGEVRDHAATHVSALVEQAESDDRVVPWA